MRNVDKYINKYSEVFSYIKNGNTVYVKGIIQPFHYKNKAYFSPERLPAGVLDGRHYLLITTPFYKERLEANLVINGENMSYRIKSVDTYRVKNEDLYVWAVLTARTGNTGDVYE